MRLWGVAMVRNEADVIEAFVRHNLGILDGLAIVDHGSCDGTAEILSELQREGLPLRVSRDDEPAFLQSLRITETARETLRDQGADFVFALDADEFLRVPSRERLERALLDVPRGMHAIAHWLTYVPDSFEDGAPFGPGHVRRRLKEERRPPAYHKVITGRGLLERPDDRVTEGNHQVRSPDESVARPHARVQRDILFIAHVPVRSRSQLESKVIIGYLAYLARSSGDEELGFHWRDLYEDLRAGQQLDRQRLLEIACNYGLVRGEWRPVSAIELTEDPVPLEFELRYQSSAVPDTLRRLMRFAETIAARRKSP
ncbi:MAG: glycosyltransferase family 2 protein [Casimicrobiaceae bacterium]